MLSTTLFLALICHIVKCEATKSAVLLHQIQNKRFPRIKEIVSYMLIENNLNHINLKIFIKIYKIIWILNYNQVLLLICNY